MSPVGAGGDPQQHWAFLSPDTDRGSKGCCVPASPNPSLLQKKPFEDQGDFPVPQSSAGSVVVSRTLFQAREAIHLQSLFLSSFPFVKSLPPQASSKQGCTMAA